ncbi:reverse transcriptase [Phytophthora megakarya]|uniref:Reverse transcriptase n=1 Tax=Phytophthora megakarya TaxID=4795 RepID=A0A225UGH7_9STRA|nr:reverse transcriptase [Phytophthora megakarya]
MDPSPVVEDRPGTSDLDLTWDSDQDYDECVYYHEGSDLYAEDVDARGVVCDIDVGEARPIALKCSKLRIQFREKLADLIKGILSAKMINYSRSQCDRVEGLLEACDEWNLSISVIKSFWGMPRVEYLGHKVSHNGLEANPKDLSALTDLAFPGSLRAMQSFLGSLNYYSRFIEDYAIYASVLRRLKGGSSKYWKQKE